MPKLFKNEDSDSEDQLKINDDYASNYDSWRQKEELHKLKAKYGENTELLMKSDEESSESSEDDEGEQLPEEFEKNFYKTLACLKNKDPRIYNENVKFFNDPLPKSEEGGTKQKKEKSLFLRDYERQIILERGGKFSDSEDEENEKMKQPRNPTYVQEQQELKESFKKVLQDDEDNEEEDLLKPKSKTKEEKQKEEEDYKEWLKGQKKNIDEEQQKELKPLRDFWTDPNLDENEKFLRDYILNKKFLEKESIDVELGYEHKAHDSDDNLSEDERNINEQEEFEHKYNFRFEEPDQEFIKRYPRTLENSLRKKDTRRAEKRAEVKARKEQEKLKKREELKQLKALKRKEIEEKIEKLKEITGNDDLELNMMDLEGDFDPNEYDKKMSQIFNEEYYAEVKDDMKPEFPDVDEELGIDTNWDNYDPSNEKVAQEEVPYYDGPHCEDPEFNMDADYDGQKKLQEELVESTKKRKRRRRTKFAEMISKEKPKFDPKKYRSFEEYYNQYYALDYEDMIGDLPCRFKYRQVVPNDYGLTVEEILMADDKELNKWCSLKRALQHKPEHRELNDVRMYKEKAANESLKRRVLRSLYRDPEEEETDMPVPSTSQISEQQDAKKKRKRKKKAQLNGFEEVAEAQNNESKSKIDESSTNGEHTKKSKNENKTKKSSENTTESSKNNPIPAETEQSNKKKRKLEESKVENNESEGVKKKKKKTKKNQTDIPINESLTQESKCMTENQKSLSIDKSNASIEQNGNVTKENKVKNKKKNDNSLNKDKNTLSKKEQRKQLFLKKKRKANEAKAKEGDQVTSLSAERLKAYGLNPKKFKNKLKYGKKQ